MDFSVSDFQTLPKSDLNCPEQLFQEIVGS